MVGSCADTWVVKGRKETWFFKQHPVEPYKLRSILHILPILRKVFKKFLMHNFQPLLHSDLNLSQGQVYPFLAHSSGNSDTDSVGPMLREILIYGTMMNSCVRVGPASGLSSSNFSLALWSSHSPGPHTSRQTSECASFPNVTDGVCDTRGGQCVGLTVVWGCLYKYVLVIF